MNDFKQEVISLIKHKRPNLTDNSIKTYLSLISTLMRKLKYKNIDDINNNEDDVLEYIESIKSTQSKKTILSSIYIITENDIFRKKMIELCNETNNKYKEQKLSDSRKHIDMTIQDIHKRHNELEQMLKYDENIENYVNFLISSLMSGVTDGIAPRRLEWCDVKTKDYDVVEDNYIDLKKKKVFFNKYKTAKVYGQQVVKIPSNIMKVINKFLKINTSGYLLCSNKLKKMNNSQLSKRLQEIYGEDIGVDMLRSIFLSDMYKDIPQLEHMEDVASQMGHNFQSAINFYVKKD